MGLSVRRITSAVPVAEVRELAGILLERGHTVDEVVDQLAEVVDEAVDWTRVVKGPIGAVLEAVDRPVVRGVVRVIVAAVNRGRTPS